MRALYTRMNKLELRTHKILTRSDWLLLADKWKSQLERYGADPEDFREKAVEARALRDKIDISQGLDEYRSFIVNLMKESPEIYNTMNYFDAVKIAGKKKELTWIRNSKRSKALLLELEQLRAKSRK